MSLCLSRSWSDCLDSTVSLAIAPCLQPWQPQSLSGLGSLHHREDQSWQLSPSAGLWLVPALPSLASDWSARHASGITSADSSLRISPQSLLGSQPRRISPSLSLSEAGPSSQPPALQPPALSCTSLTPQSALSVTTLRLRLRHLETLGDTIRGQSPIKISRSSLPPLSIIPWLVSSDRISTRCFPSLHSLQWLYSALSAANTRQQPRSQYADYLCWHWPQSLQLHSSFSLIPWSLAKFPLAGPDRLSKYKVQAKSSGVWLSRLQHLDSFIQDLWKPENIPVLTKIETNIDKTFWNDKMLSEKQTNNRRKCCENLSKPTATKSSLCTKLWGENTIL